MNYELRVKIFGFELYALRYAPCALRPMGVNHANTKNWTLPDQYHRR